jgi:uncharacterized protein
MRDLPIIDVHVMLGHEHPFSLDADELLRHMDASGIELAVARPMGAELAVDNLAGNDRVLGASARIRGLVSANPWYGQRSVDELKRCRDAGAVGLFLHPSRQGFMPIEPVAAPLVELAVEFRWPVMFYTGSYVQSDVLAVAEVARRYPQTPLILGGGGFADMWFEIVVAMREVPNLWLETSLPVGEGIRAVIAALGSDRIVFGSGEPRNCLAAALKKIDRLDLPPDVRRAILCENARRLFHLP